eukprot:1696665-Rhodomonas_salina.1
MVRNWNAEAGSALPPVVQQAWWKASASRQRCTCCGNTAVKSRKMLERSGEQVLDEFQTTAGY